MVGCTVQRGWQRPTPPLCSRPGPGNPHRGRETTPSTRGRVSPLSSPSSHPREGSGWKPVCGAAARKLAACRRCCFSRWVFVFVCIYLFFFSFLSLDPTPPLSLTAPPVTLPAAITLGHPRVGEEGEKKSCSAQTFPPLQAPCV